MRSLLLFLALLFFVAAGAAGQVPRRDCFPVESLPAEDRQAAEDLILKLMDSEALYTVIEGINPMSGGYTTFRFSPSLLELPEVDKARRLLEVFRCGIFFASVRHSARVYPDSDNSMNERFYDAIVFHLPSLREMLAEQRRYFAPLGITPFSHPLEVVPAVEYQENPGRNRALGFLYGYPDYAVHFFYSAERHRALTGEFVNRDFYSLPTVSREDRGVVWAVPRGHRENSDDVRFREAATRILSEYRERRELYVGQGKPGIVELLRDWFCDGDTCDPERPKRPAPAEPSAGWKPLPESPCLESR